MGLPQRRLAPGPEESPIVWRTVQVGEGPTAFAAELALPEAATGLVLAARTADTDDFIAALTQSLWAGGRGVMCIDVPPEVPDRARNAAGDTGQWAGRLTAAARWARTRSWVWHLPQGLAGQGAGAAAAIEAAAALDAAVAAMVVLDPRLDRVSRVALALNRAPTLALFSGRAARTDSLPRSSEAEYAVGRLPEGAEDAEAASRAEAWLAQHLG